MDYKEYLEKIAEHEQAINEIKNAYIAEHAEYKVGDRLKITESKKEIIAEVVGNTMRYGHKVEPILKKVKKDGSISEINAFLYSWTKFEKI